MPRGEHFKKVDQDEILDQFRIQAEKKGRKFFTPSELAEGLDVTGDAVRQRLYKMRGETVEQEELPGSPSTYWKKKGEEIFVTNAGFLTSITNPSQWRGQLVHPMDAPKRHFYQNMSMFLLGVIATFLTWIIWKITGMESFAVLFGLIAFATIIVGTGIWLIEQNGMSAKFWSYIGRLRVRWYERRYGGRQD